MDADDLNQMGDVAASAAPLVVPLAAGVLAGMYAKHRLAQVPATSTQGVKNMGRLGGLPADYPFISVPKLDNALFTDSPNDALGLALQHGKREDVVSALKHRAAIAYDPEYKKPGIMAHEVGHARIAQGGGMRAFNQKYLRPAGAMLGVVSMLGSYLAGRAGYLTPPQRMGLLAAGGALAAIPTLINEHQATGEAKKILDQSNYSPEVRKKNTKALHAALTTYYAGGLALPVAALGSLAWWVQRKRVLENQGHTVRWG